MVETEDAGAPAGELYGEQFVPAYKRGPKGRLGHAVVADGGTHHDGSGITVDYSLRHPRNAKCGCGSGKKFKKCCGLSAKGAA
jgi:uncharacterized protein YecA (UPF0149 family)